jgi:hypothetical protein
MIYYANRDTVMEFYHSQEGKNGLAWLVEFGALYVIRGDQDSFQWILDGDKLDMLSDYPGKCPPLAEIIAGRIIAESQNESIEPVRGEGARIGLDPG